MSLLVTHRRRRINLQKRLVNSSRFRVFLYGIKLLTYVITRVAGIEPTHVVLKTTVLPLNYTPLMQIRLLLVCKYIGLAPATVGISKTITYLDIRAL